MCVDVDRAFYYQVSEPTLDGILVGRRLRWTLLYLLNNVSFLILGQNWPHGPNMSNNCFQGDAISIESSLFNQRYLCRFALRCFNQYSIVIIWRCVSLICWWLVVCLSTFIIASSFREVLVPSQHAAHRSRWFCRELGCDELALKVLPTPTVTCGKPCSEIVSLLDLFRIVVVAGFVSSSMRSIVR